MPEESKNIEMQQLNRDKPGMKYGLPAEKYDSWKRDAEKRMDKRPFEERRIGWISELPGYRVFCCGQSTKDFFIILGLLILFYLCNALFFWVFYNITNMNLYVVLYIYGVIGALFLIGLFYTVSVKGKNIENAYLERLADEMK